MVKIERAESPIRDQEQEQQDVKPDVKKVRLIDEATMKIVKQLEYYFSDVNIINDKFMIEEIKKDDGWVTIDTLMKFSRLKALTSEANNIPIAMKECDSDIIEMSEDEKKIRRKKEIPSDDFREQLDKRTLHLSGFPQDFTFDNLVRWCNQYGPTESVQMRHYYRSKAFKGNILVVYKNEEDVTKMTEIKGLKCKDREIRLETMSQYRARKKEMAEKFKNKRADKKSKTN